MKRDEPPQRDGSSSLLGMLDTFVLGRLGMTFGITFGYEPARVRATVSILFWNGLFCHQKAFLGLWAAPENDPACLRPISRVLGTRLLSLTTRGSELGPR
jgi:hypothetical protein